ncbi:hypothetical protein Pfo_022681, partial [Paulownia fortunei]
MAVRLYKPCEAYTRIRLCFLFISGYAISLPPGESFSHHPFCSFSSLLCGFRSALLRAEERSREGFGIELVSTSQFVLTKMQGNCSLPYLNCL